MSNCPRLRQPRAVQDQEAIRTARSGGPAAGLAIRGASLALLTVEIDRRWRRAFEAVGDVHEANDDAAGFKLTRLIFAVGDLPDKGSVPSVGYCHRMRPRERIVLEGDQSRPGHRTGDGRRTVDGKNSNQTLGCVVDQ